MKLDWCHCTDMTVKKVQDTGTEKDLQNRLLG